MNNPNAFTLQIVTDNLEPEFSKGDVLIVDPDREPKAGNYVAVVKGEHTDIERYPCDAIIRGVVVSKHTHYL